MQSKAKNVDEYLGEVPPERVDALKKLRALCLETLSGYQENMAYGMPSYHKDGVVEVAFANQKNYISLYLLKEGIISDNKNLLGELNLGKGCIRYSKPEKIDLKVISRLLKESMLSERPVC